MASEVWPDLGDLPDLKEATEGIDFEVIADEYGIEEDEVTSVDDLTQKLSILFNDNDALEPDHVRGEVSDPNISSKGHLYFDLIGLQTSAIQCVVFANHVGEVEEAIVDGMEILAKGTLNFYQKRGNLSLLTSDAIPLGEGVYSRWLSEVVEQLEANGVFADKFKQDIPDFPDRIGLVTSREGDAINDLRDSLQNEQIGVDILLYNVSVQGKQAVEEIQEGVEVLDQKDVDTIVLTRGGGAEYQFRPFNTPGVVRAVFEAETPVITALGHEKDETVADRVADRSVITPTDTSTAFVSVRELLGKLEDKRSRLRSISATKFTSRITDLESQIETAYTKRLRGLKDRNEWISRKRKSLSKNYRHLLQPRLSDFDSNLRAAHNSRIRHLQDHRDWANKNRSDLRRKYALNLQLHIDRMTADLADAHNTRMERFEKRKSWVQNTRRRAVISYRNRIDNRISNLEKDLSRAFEYRKTLRNQREEQKELAKHTRKQRRIILALSLLLLSIGILIVTGII